MSASTKLTTVTNLALLGAAAYVLLGSDGPIGAKILEYRAEAALSERISAEWDALVDTDSRLGDPEASVDLIVFSDFQCAFCRQAHALIDEYLDAHPGKTVAWRHLAASGPRGERDAVAATCAARQNRFPHFSRALFSRDPRASESDYSAEAMTSGVEDLDAFSRCRSSSEARADVATDMALASRLGVAVTPTFVTPEGMESGLQSLTDVLHSLR